MTTTNEVIITHHKSTGYGSDGQRARRLPRREQEEKILTPTQVARARTYPNDDANSTSRGAPNKCDVVIRHMVEANMIATGQDVFRLGRYTDEFKRQFEIAQSQVANATPACKFCGLVRCCCPPCGTESIQVDDD